MSRLLFIRGGAAGMVLLAGFAMAQPGSLVPPQSASPTPTGAASAAPSYSLADLIARARLESPLIAVTRSEEDIAKAGVTTARAYPNPEIEVGPGRLRARQAGVSGGFSPLVGIIQPIENPRLREARVQAANARIDTAQVQTRLTESEVVAEVRDRYAAVLRLREQVQAFRDDVLLTEQIRIRVQVRVRTGEAPRFDLIRAESESAIARKNLESAELQMRQVMALLKQVVSVSLEDNFEIRSEPAPARLTEADYFALRGVVGTANPQVALAAAELERAKRQVSVEQNSVLPQVTVSASVERDPSVTISRVGAGVVVPLWNKREGPIAEARAQVVRNQFALEQRQFELQTALQAAWSSYLSAAGQVSSLESGIIDRARTAVDIAEAAYRFGERGILEYLDAQRQFRLVRNELIEARFALLLARNELDRLAGR